MVTPRGVQKGKPGANPALSRNCDPAQRAGKPEHLPWICSENLREKGGRRDDDPRTVIPPPLVLTTRGFLCQAQSAPTRKVGFFMLHYLRSEIP